MSICRNVSLSAAALTLLIGAAAPAVADQEFKGMTLTILGSPTDINELDQKSYGNKFEEDTGAKLNWVVGTAPGNLSKALVAKGKEPTFQVLMLEDPTQAQAIEAGAIQKLDYSKIPNITKVFKQGILTDGYGPAADFYRLGTCINVKEYQDHNIALPTSIDGWFDPAIAGHAILPSPANFWWLTGMQALAEHFKVPMSDPTPLFEKLKTMKPTSFYTASGEAQAKLQSGAAWLSPTSDGRCFALKMGGQPVDFIPLNLEIEGKKYPWIVAVDTWEVPVGVTGKQLELAEAFINAALTPAAQVPTTEKFGYSPTTPDGMKEAMALPKVQEAGVYKGFAFDTMYSPKAEKLTPYTSKWIDIWNRTFVK